MKKNKILETRIKKMSGNVLGIGINNKDVLKQINLNSKILECNILSNEFDGDSGKGKGKKISITKIRKKFKKKRIDYLICDYEMLNDYLKSFIKDSIYITKGYIYFCTKNPEVIKRKYNRYHIKLEEIKCSDATILVIDVSKAKNNKIKELFYQIYDDISYLIDIVTNLLLS